MREYKVIKLPSNRNDMGETPEIQIENILNELGIQGFKIIKVTEWALAPERNILIPPIIFMEKEIVD